MTPNKELERILVTTVGPTITLPRQLAEDLYLGTQCEDGADTLSVYLLPDHSLTQIERAILTRLSTSLGRPVSAKKLLSCSRTASEEALWVHINRLRKKLDTGRVEIQSVRSAGYQLVAKTSRPS